MLSKSVETILSKSVSESCLEIIASISLSKFLCSPLHPNLPFCKQCMIFWILERGFDNERADGPHTVAATWNIVLCLVHTSICIGSLSNTVGGFFLQKIVLPKRFGGIGGFRPFPTLQKYFFAENLFADLGDITPPPPPRPLRKKSKYYLKCSKAQVMV